MSTGVRRHRRTVMPPTSAAGLSRVDVPAAAVHSAGWAVSDRQAALLLCLVLQQRLTSPDRLQAAWRSSTTRVRRARRQVLTAVVADAVRWRALARRARLRRDVPGGGPSCPEPSGRARAARWEGLPRRRVGGHRFRRRDRRWSPRPGAQHDRRRPAPERGGAARRPRAPHPRRSGCGSSRSSSWRRSFRRTALRPAQPESAPTAVPGARWDAHGTGASGPEVSGHARRNARSRDGV